MDNKLEEGIPELTKGQQRPDLKDLVFTEHFWQFNMVMSVAYAPKSWYLLKLEKCPLEYWGEQIAAITQPSHITDACNS